MSRKKSMFRLGAVVMILGIAATVYVLRPAADSSVPAGDQDGAATESVLPRLVDLGADKCVSCKLMAPILDELKESYAGILRVDFIDVWKDPAAAKLFGIKVIPTQIFFAPDGTELFRHEGFYGREEILAKWRELGVELPDKGA